MQQKTNRTPVEPEDAELAKGLEGADGELNQDASVLDRLGCSLGAVPWWVVSGSFHAVVLALFVLMMMEIPQEKFAIATMTSTPNEPVKPDIEKQLQKIEISDRPFKREVEQPMVADPVEIIEPIDVIAPVETPDDSEEHAAFGREDAISNLPVGDIGRVGVMSVGVGQPAGAYGSRSSRGRRKAALRPGHGCGTTENAVENALAWLAKHQEPDGHWDTVKYNGQEAGKCDTAATGLATLAFLGAGYTEKRGQYKDTVQRAIDWMIKQQKADGCVAPGANGKEASYGPGYHHAICGLALAEAYGMSRNPALKTAAQQAVNYSVNVHQDGQGSEKLGWRYAPKTAGDISVTGWFIMQLKSARMAGLAVPDEGFRGAMAFLDSVEVKGAADDPYAGNRFKYTPSRAEATPMTTMIGCTARMFLGWPKEQLEPAVAWAVESHGVPNWGANGESVDWYYMYYGTMTAFQMGGATWTKWNEAMKAMLPPHQRNDGDEKGSWDPTGHYANLGRVWSTTNGALCLEVYYRYSALYKEGAVKH